MESTCVERRDSRLLNEGRLKGLINEAQAETLRALEQVGWYIRFVRMQPQGEPLAGVYDPDKHALAIIDGDGHLVENPRLAFRI